MSSSETNGLAERAERLYEAKWKASLEATHHGEYLAIEPDSEEYFLGRTLSEAVGAARKAHPDRLVFGMRIGYVAAVFFGGTCPS